MPDWLNVGSTGPGSQIPDAPTCMGLSAEGHCGWSWQNVQDCTVYRCNHHIIGICSSHGYQIDRNCVCKGLSTSICSAACATPVYNREYLNWLYATCIGYSGWNDPGSASVDTLSIGSTASGYNSEGNNTEKSYDIEATYAIPSCVNRSDSCQGGYAAAWTNCIVSSSEVYLADNGYTVDYYSKQFDSGVSWTGTVLVVLSTTIDVQACVGAMLTLHILFTTPGSTESAQGLPRSLACLQIGRLTC
jgi:hypothetical protein